MTHMKRQSAARVSGACFVMGQAAGIGADLALKSGGSAGSIGVPVLQARLESEGAYLGRTW